MLRVFVRKTKKAAQAKVSFQSFEQIPLRGYFVLNGHSTICSEQGRHCAFSHRHHLRAWGGCDECRCGKTFAGVEGKARLRGASARQSREADFHYGVGHGDGREVCGRHAACKKTGGEISPRKTHACSRGKRHASDEVTA